MNITIIGGGNIGTDFAVDCASAGNRVTICTSKPGAFAKTLIKVDKEGNEILRGDIYCATSDYQVALRDAEIIFITLPAFMLKELSKQILPYTTSGQCIGFIPGTGGGEIVFSKHLKKGCILFGLQRVVSIARLINYGKSVCSTGKKSRIFLSSIPALKCEELCSVMQNIFSVPCEPLPNYLCVTLTPSNPILHTARLKTMFNSYSSGMYYDREILFYEEWDDKASELLLACDLEHTRICAALKDFDLQSVIPLSEYYENKTVHGFTKKIRSISAFSGIKAPMVYFGAGWIPDFESRYFTADFPYGLKIIQQIAQMYSIPTPAIDETYAWYNEKCGNKHNHFDFAENGIVSVNDFVGYYKR